LIIEHWALDFDHLLCVNEQWKMLNDKWFGCGQRPALGIFIQKRKVIRYGSIDTRDGLRKSKKGRSRSIQSGGEPDLFADKIHG
jgi:hypothetical protein